MTSHAWKSANICLVCSSAADGWLMRLQRRRIASSFKRPTLTIKESGKFIRQRYFGSLHFFTLGKRCRQRHPIALLKTAAYFVDAAFSPSVSSVRNPGTEQSAMRSQILTSCICCFLIPSVALCQEAGCCATDFGGGYYAGGSAGQMFPYDQQDPWLHGQHQRVPSYGGYRSFRPYNYRHVAPQAQIASNWGASHGMTYSHQFFNRYRTSYLDGNLQAGNAESLSGLVHYPEQTKPQIMTQPVSDPTVQTVRELALPLMRTILPQQRSSRQ